MPNISFRGEVYDVNTLVRCASLGHDEKVNIKDIVTMTACAEACEGLTLPVAMRDGGKMCVLVGTIPDTKEWHKLRVITKHILKRASVKALEAARRVDPPQNQYGNRDGYGYGNNRSNHFDNQQNDFANRPRFSDNNNGKR